MNETASSAVAETPKNKNNLEVRNSSLAISLREQLSAIPISRETGIQIANIGQATLVADLLVKGGYAPKGASTEFAAVAILQGALLGLNPIQAIQAIAVVNGRPTLFGDGMAAVVKSSKVYVGEKVDYFNGPNDESGYRFTVWRRVGDKDVETTEQFTVADAKRAGLWDKIGPWRTNPRQMLYNRARAFAYRHAFPDLLQGIRCYEEERDIIDVTPVEPARPAPAPAKTQSKLRETLRLPAPTPAETVQTAAKEPAAAAEPVKPFAAPPSKDRDVNPALL